MIRERQRALARGEAAKFCHLQNSVNRLRKSCQAKYYAANVEQLRDYKPRRWWKEVKKLAGMQATTRTDTISVLRNIDQGLFPNPTALANTTNKAFLAPMSIFTPLAPCTSCDAYHSDQPPISKTCVFRKLASLNPAKA